MFTFPLFMLTYVPIALVALVKKCQLEAHPATASRWTWPKLSDAARAAPQKQRERIHAARRLQGARMRRRRALDGPVPLHPRPLGCTSAFSRPAKLRSPSAMCERRNRCKRRGPRTPSPCHVRAKGERAFVAARAFFGPLTTRGRRSRQSHGGGSAARGRPRSRRTAWPRWCTRRPPACTLRGSALAPGSGLHAPFHVRQAVAAREGRAGRGCAGGRSTSARRRAPVRSATACASTLAVVEAPPSCAPQAVAGHRTRPPAWPARQDRGAKSGAMSGCHRAGQPAARRASFHVAH